MLKSLPFDSDPDAGITRTFHHDPDTDVSTIHTEQDVTEIIADNKVNFNAIDEQSCWKDTNRVASIPMSLYFDLKAKGIIDDQAAMKKWLNDPDNRFFRTRPGRI